VNGWVGLHISHVDRKPRTSGSLWEYGKIEGDVSLQNASKASLFVSGRGAEMQRARDVGGAIPVLAARVTQINLVAGHLRGAVGLGGIVDNCRVGADGRDGFKGERDKVGLLPVRRMKAKLAHFTGVALCGRHVRSEVVELLRSSVFRVGRVTCPQCLLQPREVGDLVERAVSMGTDSPHARKM
jgi:hypothetical protein